MKKIIKISSIFVIGIILIINILILADYFIIAKMNYYVENQLGGDTNRNENDLPFDKNKKQLITIGCSFTYGDGIAENETLDYHLQKLTHRKTYNRGQSGEGPQNILLQIRTFDFFNNKPDLNPEYLIYTFISDHIRRMYVHNFSFGSRNIYDYYRYDGKNFIQRDFKTHISDYIRSSYLAQKIEYEKFLLLSADEKFDLFKAYMLEIKKEFNKRYPDAKFVIIIYNLDVGLFGAFEPFRTDRWSELEQEGIKIINFDTPEYAFLTEEEYISPLDHAHPSGKAWDVLTPVIVKELGL